MIKKDFDEVLPIISKIALFKYFDFTNQGDLQIIRDFYNNADVKLFKKGDVIIKEGDIGNEFYILTSGRVHVSKTTYSGDTLALAELQADKNVFFGETALISKDPRTATVSCIDDCKTIVLTNKVFDKLCEENALFGYRVIKVLCERLSSTLRDVNKDKAVLYEALVNEISAGD